MAIAGVAGTLAAGLAACGGQDAEDAVQQTAEAWVAGQFAGRDEVCTLELDLSRYETTVLYNGVESLRNGIREALFEGCKLSYDPDQSVGATRTGRKPTRGEIDSEVAYVLRDARVDVGEDEAKVFRGEQPTPIIVLRRIDDRWKVDTAKSDIGFTSAIPPEPPT